MKESKRSAIGSPAVSAALATAAAALALCCACAPARDARANALLVTLDTTRGDAPSCYGVTEGVTPRIDRLAQQGVLYERAYTVAPLTLPAHASILTGLYPPRHTVRVNGRRPLPQSAETLAEAVGATGYQTAGFIAAVVLAPTFGLDQGFEHYDAPRKTAVKETSFYDERPAGEVVDAAVAWLGERDRERPFFLWVHLFDPHQPFEPPPGYTERVQDANPYLAEVRYADDELARLFGALEEEGELERTFVAVVADHGESLGERREKTHGDYCWNTTIRVPLLFVYPDGFGAGTRVDETVSVVDVAPTLAEAMGVRLSPEIDGRSLYRRSDPEAAGAYFESYSPYAAYGWSPFSGWVDDEGKYIHSSHPVFFAIDRDPLEEHDLYDRPGIDVSPYRDAIARMADRPALEFEESGPSDRELQEHIRRLGYAGSDEERIEMPHPLADTGLPSAIDRVELAWRINDAFALTSGTFYAEAVEVWTEVLAEDPRNTFALELYGTCLLRLRRFREAIEPIERQIALGRRGVSAYFNLGVCRSMTDEPERALAAFESALELAPGDERILGHLARIAGELGRTDEAREYERQLGGG